MYGIVEPPRKSHARTKKIKVVLYTKYDSFVKFGGTLHEIAQALQSVSVGFFLLLFFEERLKKQNKIKSVSGDA